jgi:hypothetical protein
VRALLHPVEHATQPIYPPLDDNMLYLVEQVPWGRTVLLYDVGLPGHIDGLSVLDGVGLVSNAFARSERGDDPLGAERFGVDGIYLWLRTDYDGGRVRLSDAAHARLPFEERFELEGHPAVVLRVDEERPTRAEVRARWCGLAGRFPSLLGYRDRCQRARFMEGDLALVQVEEPERMTFAGGSVPLDFVESRGFAMYWNGELLSIPLQGPMELELQADDPREQGAQVELAWPACGGEVEEVRVHGAFKRVVQPPCAGARLAVRFLNDDSGVGWDRNLYALLRGDGGAPSARALIERASMPLQVEGHRGIAMRWDGELMSVPLLGAVELAVDVDDPMDQGAQLELQWEQCDTQPWTVWVQGAAVHRLQPPCEGSRLSMRFQNDASGPGWDRTLYLWLREVAP